MFTSYIIREIYVEYNHKHNHRTEIFPFLIILQQLNTFVRIEFFHAVQMLYFASLFFDRDGGMKGKCENERNTRRARNIK